MSEFSLSKINDRISKESKFIEPLRKSIDEVIVGQDELINKILIGLLANGHSVSYTHLTLPTNREV